MSMSKGFFVGLRGALLLVLASVVAQAQESVLASEGQGSSIELLSLRGGEVVTPGSDLEIRWTPAAGDATVRIELWDGRRHQWRIVCATVDASAGLFRWQVPQLPGGDRYRLRLTLAGPSGSGIIMSPTYFSIGASKATLQETQQRSVIGTSMDLR